MPCAARYAFSSTDATLHAVDETVFDGDSMWTNVISLFLLYASMSCLKNTCIPCDLLSTNVICCTHQVIPIPRRALGGFGPALAPIMKDTLTTESCGDPFATHLESHSNSSLTDKSEAGARWTCHACAIN